MGYEDHQKLMEEQNALVENLKENGVLTEEVVMKVPATFHNLTVAEGGKLTIQGTTLTISGESYVDSGTIELTDGAELIINGTQDNPDGRIYVRNGGCINGAGGTVSVPNGSIYVDFYAADSQAPDMAPEKLTAQTWVMNQANLRDSLNNMAVPEGQSPVYYRYEIIANYSFAIEEELVEIPAHISFYLQNQGDVNDTVVLTIPEGKTLKISGCYMGIYEGTQLRVEGTMVDDGYLRTHVNSSVNVTGNGVLQVLGHLDNQGIVCATSEEQLIRDENSTWENNDPIFAGQEQESFISLRFLDNWGNGWFENHDNTPVNDIRIAPGQQFHMIAYLNQWNYDTLAWDMTPIHASKLVAGENLVLEPFSSIHDGSNHTQDGQNFDCFFRLRAADGVMDVESGISYSNTGIQTKVELGRNAGGFYSANPVGADANSLWLNEYCVSSENKTFWFYFDPSRDFEEGWSVSRVDISADRDIGGGVFAEQVADNLYKITVSDETADKIYSLREFWLNLNYTLAKGEQTRYEGTNLRCYAGDFGEPNASFSIDGVRYHASWNYDGLFRFDQDENGDYYPVPVEIKGVSYDIASNTLTLNGAHLNMLEIDHHWYDEERGEEGWNLPDSRFNIELVGDNSISATNDHALRISNDVFLTIRGDGSLNISLNGDEGNMAHSAFEANNSDVTIEGKAKVTVRVSGEGYYWTEEGPGDRANMVALRGHSEDRWLRLREDAVLTTIVPENVCVNGRFENGVFVEDGGFNGLEFTFVEVNDNATLNTQTIRVMDGGRGNAFGGYYQHGGTVNVTGMPYYNPENQNENGTVGHYHFSGVEADYGQIEINNGTLNITMHATDSQMAKSVYYHGLQTRGRRIDLNGGEINISGNFSGTGIKVGEDNWDGGTNAWVNFNNATLNMTGSSLYRCAVDVAPNGSVYFNGGRINTHRADINIRGYMEWNGTNLNATECGLHIVEGGRAILNGGMLNIKDGNFVLDNQYDENGGIVNRSILDMRGGYVELDNSFAYLLGSMKMENGALVQSVDFRKITTDAKFVQAFIIGRDGYLEICNEAYLEVIGTSNTDGIYNEGTIRQHGGTVNVDVDKTALTAALFGPGENRFEDGNVYLNGYNGLVQFCGDEHSRLYVGGNTTMAAVGWDAGIVTYAPAEFAGGNVNAFAVGEVRTEADGNNTKTIYPYAVIVENDSEDTNASLTITGGSHYFGTLHEEGIPVCARGLGALHAPVKLEGGDVTIVAETAVYNVTAKDAASTVMVPVIVSMETGAALEPVYSQEEEQGLYTVAGSVNFLTSQNCGENLWWSIEYDAQTDTGTLVISGNGDMDDYHMPINDPASWRVAPWYPMGDAITRVVVEEGVTGIGNWAFGRLANVEEIVYPSTVTSIDMTSSYACPKLEKFTVAEENPVYSVANLIAGETNSGEVLIENGSLVRAAVKGITDYTAGDDITTIGMGAFDSSALKTLDLNKVQVIQNYAFADCYDLKEVKIPEGVTTIEMTVFQNSGLESITIPVSVGKIRNYAFDGCTALADVIFLGSENQWNAITIGSGNNALTSVPVTFLETATEVAGEPYLSYRMLTFGEQGYFEELEEAKTEMTIPVGFWPVMVVYCNVWNDNAKTWERFAVDPEQLYAVSEDGTVVNDLEIGPFRNYPGIGIEEGEPNSYNFFEMSFQSGWGTHRDLCMNVGQDKVAKLRVYLARSQVGFYSADPTNLAEDPDARNAIWLNYYAINPNVSGHSVYFALTEHPGAFGSVSVSSDRLTAEDMAEVTVEQINNSVYKITLPDEVAAKVYDYRGIPIQVTYTIPATETTEAEEGTVEFVFGSVSFAADCVNFVIDGVWYEYYPGLEGYFSWDDENQKRLAYKELPGGITYDYDNDILTMTNSTIESLQVYWNWHNEETGESGYSTKDNDLVLKLIGENKIINPNSNAALAVGDGLELIITSENEGSLLISATNENTTADHYSQSAVNIYNGGSLVIEGNAAVTTSISTGGKQLNDAWLMNIWAGGNNSITVRENASLRTTVPDGARDDGDANVNGYRGIDWFGQLRVEDNATLTTQTLGLNEYYDENNTFHGKGSYVQTGGTVTIEALGWTNDEGRHNYQGFMINGGTDAQISGGKLVIRANAANVAADNPGQEGTSYAWFCGIQADGHLDISGESTQVEIQLPNDGTGLEMAHTEVSVRDGATLKVTGGESDNYALTVNQYGNFQLHGGNLNFENAKVSVRPEGSMEIHDGMVVIDNGMAANTGETLSIRGDVHLNGGTVTVSGNVAVSVFDGGCLNQNGAVLTVNGLESPMGVGNGGSIHLNGGNTVVTMGKTGESISNWYSTVNVYDGGYLEVNDGFHRFQVAGTASDVWLCALDVRGHVNFNGGTLELDAGSGGQALFNRETGDVTIGFNNGMGAVSLDDGVGLWMQDRGEGNFSLGADSDDLASNAAILNVSAGDNSSWNIVKDDSGNTLLFIKGNQDMYNFYMPAGDEANWAKTPWFDYKDQITHVFVEDGINHIGDWAFAYMPKLSFVQLPGSVNHISTSAFYGCSGLETFSMPGNDSYNLEEGTRSGPDENGYYSGSVIIEGGWKILKAVATLTEFEVPHYISEIGNGAFQNCTGLTSITFATDEYGWSNVWNIGSNAFENTGLTKINLPQGVKAIGGSAFAGCGNVTEITLPETVNAIRPYAFSGCGNTETTVTFAGNESQWNQISVGTGNNALDKVVFQGGEAEGGEDYLSFRWLTMGENGWEENENPAEPGLSMPAGMTFYGVFYYNHWDETSGKWTAQAVIPTAQDTGISIRKITDLLAKYDWKIPEGETNAESFVMLTTAPNAWDDGDINNGIVTYKEVTMDIAIQRNACGFYSSETASNDTWLNDYVMNPLQQINEFYFIYEGSDGWTMDTGSFRIWNHNGISNSLIRKYDCGNGVFRIVLDPVLLQDAWRYGNGFQLWVGFDVVNGEDRRYEETDFQLKPMDLGNPDARFEINDQQYLYFADGNGWMTEGDPANDYRPGVVNLPAGVSYSYNEDTAEQILTLNNAKLNNLNLVYQIRDEKGDPTGETWLPKDNLTLNLIGSSVIESSHRNALEVSGGLKVTVTGSGSLRLHSHNDPENRNENGERYAFDTVRVENGSTLEIAGGNVTAEISGEGYWNEGNPAMPAALRGWNDASLVISGGSLTTVVPGNARDNGPGEVDFENYYSTHAIGEFKNITVKSGTLNTTTLYMVDGETYTQSGGTVNIEGKGHLSRQSNEYGHTWNQYHYNGLQLNQGAKADITGGQLNLTVTPQDWEHGSGSYYNGLSIAGGEATISGTAQIHVTGAFEGNAISVGHDFDENGQPCANGTLTMTGGTLTVGNETPDSHMNGVDVSEGCTANIAGGTLELRDAGINNMGTLNIGAATVKLNQAVWSNGHLTIDGTTIDVTHAEGTDMYAWDIVPGSKFDFVSGTITGKNTAFMIGGEMWIHKGAELTLTDSDFHADGAIILNGGSLTMSQEELVDNKFLGTVTNEWGDTWDEYEHQSRLYVSGELNLNSGELSLTNVPMNVVGNAVVNQNGAKVTINNETATPAERNGNGYETDNWMVAVRADEGTTLNFNSGSFTMTNSNFDNGLESNGMININDGVVTITMTNADANSALRSNGDLYIRGGELTVDTKGFAALAAQGQTHISGGTVKLSGEVGYHHWYEEGFEQGKLTVTGGTIDIDAVNTGIDLYNDMVVTGGTIDIDVSGYRQSFTDEKGVPMTLWAGCGIMGYNEAKKISVSINGGTVDIDVAEDLTDCNTVSIFGILGGRNTTVRINGGDIGIRARTALYAESQDNAKHILINNRLHVLSMETGNTLELSSGIVEVEREGETVTWYVDTFEEDETWTTPYNNAMMADYAKNLRIVSKSAGTNASWDMKDGTLTITSPGAGTMAATAPWNLVADKVTRLELGLKVDHPVDFIELLPNLQSVKAPHASDAETYAKTNNLSLTYVHDMVIVDGVERCSFEDCAYASVQSIVESDLPTNEKVEAVQKIETEELKTEMQQDAEVVKQIAKLEEELIESEDTVLKVTVEAAEEAPIQSGEITGAALNVTEENTTKVALIIAKPEVEPETDTEQYEDVVRFSMNLQTTVEADSGNETTTMLNELQVPVQITLPVPEKMLPVSRLVILHYHDDDVNTPPEEVSFTSEVREGVTYVSFVVSGFSDYEMAKQQRKLQVKLSDETVAFGETPKLEYQVLEDGNVVDLPENIGVTPVISENSDVLSPGVYTIDAELTQPEDDNTIIEVVTGKLTVTKKQYTVTMASNEMTIGDALPELNYTAEELPEGITITPYVEGISTAADITRAGEYVITAKPVENENYIVKIVPGTLTVNKQKVIAVTDAEQTIRIGEDFKPVYTFKLNDENGDVLTEHDLVIHASGYNVSKAGQYTITAYVEPHDRYEVEVQPATLTVIRDIVVTIADAQIKVGETLPTVFDFSIPGDMEAGSITLKDFQVTDGETVLTDMSAPGVYTITAEPATWPEYHNVTVKPGKLTVVQDVAVTIRDAQMTLGEEWPEFGFETDPDVADGVFTLEYKIKDAEGNVVEEITEAGDYTITAEVVGPEYYNVEVRTGTLTVRAVLPIAGANMSLGNELAINFFVKKEDVGDNHDYYIVVTKTYADGRDDVVVRYDFEDWMDYNSTYYGVKFNDVAAKEMADTIYVQTYHSDGMPASTVWVDSIRDYAVRMFAKATEVKKTMYVDMLNYGAAAQTKFEYGVDDLANSTLTEEQQAYATQTNDCTDYRVEGENYYGSNLNLGSNITLNMFFENVDTSMYAVATFTDHYGNHKEVRIEGDTFYKYKEGIYRISINGMAVADVKQLITCKVYTAEGVVVASAQDSVESYIARMSETNELYIKILKFATSAYNYFH